MDKPKANKNIITIDTSKLTRPLFFLILSIVLGVLAIFVFFFYKPDALPGNPDTTTLNITPVPTIYELPEETFEDLTNEGLVEITGFEVMDQYPNGDELQINGKLSMKNGEIIEIIGLPARTDLLVKTDQDFFVVAEQNYEVSAFLKGTPLFFDLDEDNLSLQIRTISAGQENKIQLTYKEILK